jgi:hypothetical protein
MSGIVSGAYFGRDTSPVTNRVPLGPCPLPYLREVLPSLCSATAAATRALPSCRSGTPPRARRAGAATGATAPPPNRVPGFSQPLENLPYFLLVLPAKVETVSPAAEGERDRFCCRDFSVVQVTCDNFPIAPGHPQSPFGTRPRTPRGA